MSYRERAKSEIETAQPEAVLAPILRKLVEDSAEALAGMPPDAREAAARARAASVADLEGLHARLREAFERRGIHYHRAATASEAVGIVQHLLRRARRVAKSKSMVAEEIGLTRALRQRGIDVLETDIGEYVVDLEGRGPSHITAPALHLNRTRIRELLARAGHDATDDDPQRLSRLVRDTVARFFEECDAAITGANAVIASSGRVVIVENEGNVALGVSHPQLHIVVTGLEKVVPDEAAALAVLQVLAPSATAQPLTAFTHFVADPLPGQQRHVVFVDNGRSAIAADPRYRDLLRCIRCGACMNACPVYRVAGGLSYGSVYMGPVGAVLSPLLWRDGRYADLPFASSLCGRCSEVCPVGIPLHRMLLELRADAAQAEHTPAVERLAWRAWAAAFGRGRGRTAIAAGRWLWRAARLLRRPRPGDPRTLPPLGPIHTPASLAPAGPAGEPPPPPPPLRRPEPLLVTFRERAATLGAEVTDAYTPEPGDRTVEAAAAVAATGSVLLTAEAADRRGLLRADRVVVLVDADRVVPYPADLEPFLGDGEALILTGASRTADIEKQIVRGIHGSERLTIVLRGAG